jgi:hypothetical protein
MPVIGFLGPAMAVAVLVIALLSGALSVLREFLTMYYPSKLDEKKTFWAWSRIAFVVAAVLLWTNERHKVNQLQSRSSEAHGHVLITPQISINWVASHPRWPFKVGDIPQSIIDMTTVGRPFLTNVDVAGKFTLASVPSVANGKAFEEFLAKAEYVPAGTLPPNQHRYFTYEAQKLQASDIDDLLKGKAALTMMGRIRWHDDTGCYATDYIESQVVEKGEPGYNWRSDPRSLNELSIPCGTKH